MSSLKKQLENASRDHRQQRYPGDLARDLGLVQVQQRPRWRLAAAILIGAGLLLAIMWRNPTPTHPITLNQIEKAAPVQADTENDLFPILTLASDSAGFEGMPDWSIPEYQPASSGASPHWPDVVPAMSEPLVTDLMPAINLEMSTWFATPESSQP